MHFSFNWSKRWEMLTYLTHQQNRVHSLHITSFLTEYGFFTLYFYTQALIYMWRKLPKASSPPKLLWRQHRLPLNCSATPQCRWTGKAADVPLRVWIPLWWTWLMKMTFSLWIRLRASTWVLVLESTLSTFYEVLEDAFKHNLIIKHLCLCLCLSTFQY